MVASLVRMAIQGMTQGWKFVLPDNFRLPMLGGSQAVVAAGNGKARRLPPAPPVARDNTDEKAAAPAPKKIAPVARSNGNPNSGGKKRARRQSRR